MHSNPIIWADYPDLDVIRVDGTYYMASTTMHMNGAFSHLEYGEWKPLGPAHKMLYKLDYFHGLQDRPCQFATLEAGGTAAFSDLRYSMQSYKPGGRV